MKTKITLYAGEGLVLTDGEHFGKIVHLEIGADAHAWREITEEEYKQILESTHEDIRGADA